MTLAWIFIHQEGSQPDPLLVFVYFFLYEPLYLVISAYVLFFVWVSDVQGLRFPLSSCSLFRGRSGFSFIAFPCPFFPRDLWGFALFPMVFAVVPLLGVHFWAFPFHFFWFGVFSAFPLSSFLCFLRCLALLFPPFLFPYPWLIRKGYC